MRHLKSMAPVLPLLSLLWQPYSALANQSSAATTTAHPSATTSAAAKAPQDKSMDAFLTPGDNLVVAGIPSVPKRLMERVGRYTEFRTASFFDWHPLDVYKRQPQSGPERHRWQREHQRNDRRQKWCQRLDRTERNVKVLDPARDKR